MTPEQKKNLLENRGHEMVILAQNIITLNHNFEEEIFAETNEMETAYWIYFRGTKTPDPKPCNLLRHAKDAQIRFMHYAKKLSQTNLDETSTIAEIFYAAATEYESWKNAKVKFYATLNITEL